jgi:outer membrane lipoprotein carrier protein
MNLFKAALLPLIILFAGSAQAGEGERLLDKFLTDTKTMSADFVQTLRAKDGSVMKESSGRFYLQRPGKFRWDYALPYEQQIVSDGSAVWIYDVDLQQVTVQKQNTAMSNTPMALVEGRLELKQAFEVRELDNRDGVYRLELINKNKDTDFKGVVVGMDRLGLRFMQLRDQFEQTTDIVFSSLVTNPDLKPALFKFTPPPGVDVFGGS